MRDVEDIENFISKTRTQNGRYASIQMRRIVSLTKAYSVDQVETAIRYCIRVGICSLNEIQAQWMDIASNLLSEGLSEEEYKNELNNYLSFEISSPTNLRKTREILMRIWFYEDDSTAKKIREDAIRLKAKYPDEKFVINWCMLLINYPVFSDLSKMIGRISEFNDCIKPSQLKQKLFDEWGERTTLYHSTDKIIATMKDLGAIVANTPGSYTVIKHRISKDEPIAFLLRVAMIIDKGSYYEFTELSCFNNLFPFEYIVSKEYILTDDHFMATHFAGEITISLKE